MTFFIGEKELYTCISASIVLFDHVIVLLSKLYKLSLKSHLLYDQYTWKIKKNCGRRFDPQIFKNTRSGTC